MIDKYSQALALMREAFEDAQTGAGFMPPVDLAAEVDGAQRVINPACAVRYFTAARWKVSTHAPAASCSTSWQAY